jgi:hypothetical protein
MYRHLGGSSNEQGNGEQDSGIFDGPIGVVGGVARQRWGEIAVTQSEDGAYEVASTVFGKATTHELNDIVSKCGIVTVDLSDATPAKPLSVHRNAGSTMLFCGDRTAVVVRQHSGINTLNGFTEAGVWLSPEGVSYSKFFPEGRTGEDMSWMNRMIRIEQDHGSIEIKKRQQELDSGWGAARPHDNPAARHAIAPSIPESDAGLPIESADDAMLRMLGGASFGPGTKVVLPSGRTLSSGEAQAFSSAFASGGPQDRPVKHTPRDADYDTPGAHLTPYDYDNPLAAANDRWTGDPEIDLAALIGRAYDADRLESHRRAIRSTLPEGHVPPPARRSFAGWLKKLLGTAGS